MSTLAEGRSLRQAQESPGSRRRVGRWIAPLVVVAAAGVGWIVWQQAAWPKRFGVVAEGRLYRSGELSPRQLETVVREAGVRTVLSLLNPDTPESAAERATAERLGVRWINVALTGDGANTREQRDAIRRVILDEDAAPLLVHCAAGVNRTGLACGMYRLHREGWSYEQVLAEMRRYGFDDLEKHESLRAGLREEAALARARPPGDEP